jgi:adenine-specific DNA-methyltransferase
LSLLHNRLRLTKPLLKKDGVLILTIDDNELFHIGSLLEEMFSSYDQFIVTIEHNRRGRRGKNFAKTNEWAIFLIPKGMDLIQEENTNGKIGGETRNLRRTGSGSKRTERPRKFYPIWVNKKTLKVMNAGDPIRVDSEWKTEEKEDLISIWPIDEDGREKNWHYGVERTRKCIELGQLEARVRNYGIQVYYTLREKESKKYKTVWSDSKYDASTHGSVLLEKILGESGKFDYPKSLYAVLECIRATAGNRKNAIVLDYFAGSGTTGHAVLELNRQDGGDRTFILCTNNENGIAVEACLPRLKNVINGYKYSGEDKTIIFEEKITVKLLEDIEFLLEDMERLKKENENTYDKTEIKIEDDSIRLYGIKKSNDKKEGLGGNLKYFKTAFVPANPTDKNKTCLTQKTTEMLCIKENTFEKIKSNEQYKIFRNNKRYTGIIFDHQAIDDFKKEISKMDGKFSVYVFSLGDDTFDEEFEDMNKKVKLSPIPEAILRVYRRFFK